MEIATLYVTTGSRAEALKIAETLLMEKLVACANVLEGMTSLYRWEGEIRRETEAVVLLKTTLDLVDIATSRIRELHSYDCPCVVAWRSVGGNQSYFQWVAEETDHGPADLTA